MQHSLAVGQAPIDTALAVLDDLSAAIARDSDTPGFLERFVRREFERLDHALEALARAADRERVRQFALTMRVCLHAARNGYSFDWEAVIGWHGHAAACTRQ